MTLVTLHRGGVGGRTRTAAFSFRCFLVALAGRRRERRAGGGTAGPPARSGPGSFTVHAGDVSSRRVVHAGHGPWVEPPDGVRRNARPETSGGAAVHGHRGRCRTVGKRPFLASGTLRRRSPRGGGSFPAVVRIPDGQCHDLITTLAGPRTPASRHAPNRTVNHAPADVRKNSGPVPSPAPPLYLPPDPDADRGRPRSRPTRAAPAATAAQRVALPPVPPLPSPVVRHACCTRPAPDLPPPAAGFRPTLGTPPGTSGRGRRTRRCDSSYSGP